MNVQKEAQRDAREYARAQMFHGQGAGTRRRLIQASVDDKSARIPGYSTEFGIALTNQDMSTHVRRAKQERKAKDAQHLVQRNVRALIQGNRHNLTPAVTLAATAWYVAKETGADAKIKAYGKKKVERVGYRIRLLKIEYKIQKAKRQLAKEF